jgi:hypothetical protein
VILKDTHAQQKHIEQREIMRPPTTTTRSKMCARGRYDSSTSSWLGRQQAWSPQNQRRVDERTEAGGPEQHRKTETHRVSMLALKQIHRVSMLALKQIHRVSMLALKQIHRVSMLALKQIHRVSMLALKQIDRVSMLALKQIDRVSAETDTLALAERKERGSEISYSTNSLAVNLGTFIKGGRVRQTSQTQ